MKKMNTKKMILSAILIAIGLVLPFLTGQLQTLGKLISPLHIPVLICAYALGASYAALVGAILPLLRSLIFGMPPMYPMALCMAFEMATYGLIGGWLYHALPKLLPKIFKNNALNVYVSLSVAMLLGRFVYAVVFVLTNSESTLAQLFVIYGTNVAESQITILLHLAIVPAIVLSLKEAKVIPVR